MALRYCTEPKIQLIQKFNSDEIPLNLIVLGKTGDGKSSLLNDFFDKEIFKKKLSAKSQTKDVQTHTGFWAPLNPYIHNKENFGCNISVVDTPGFGDSQLRDEVFFNIIQKELLNILLNKGGIHSFLIVFKISSNIDSVLKTMDTFYKLLSSISENNNDYWNNVLLIFTHVDLINGSAARHQTHKLALKKINQTLKDKYHFQQELPMLWISTQPYVCGYLKGLGECDCERGNKYHSDCRRRLFEQVWKRRSIPFKLSIDSNTGHTQNDVSSVTYEDAQ